jgi:hypothetical protein
MRVFRINAIEDWMKARVQPSDDRLAARLTHRLAACATPLMVIPHMV